MYGKGIVLSSPTFFSYIDRGENLAVRVGVSEALVDYERELLRTMNLEVLSQASSSL